MVFFWRSLRLSISRGGESVQLLRIRMWSLLSVARVRRWQGWLGLFGYRARLEPTHPLQVTDADGHPGVELVGVVVEGDLFRLIHTRRLRTDDIVHELLHVLCPEWPHESVEAWTDLIVSDPSLAQVIAQAMAPHLPIAIQTPTTRRRNLTMTEFKAFNLKTRRPCTIVNPELVTLKNGCPAVRGTASDDGVTTVVRILSQQAAEGLRTS